MQLILSSWPKNSRMMSFIGQSMNPCNEKRRSNDLLFHLFSRQNWRKRLKFFLFYYMINRKTSRLGAWFYDFSQDKKAWLLPILFFNRRSGDAFGCLVRKADQKFFAQIKPLPRRIHCLALVSVLNERIKTLNSFSLSKMLLRNCNNIRSIPNTFYKRCLLKSLKKGTFWSTAVVFGDWFWKMLRWSVYWTDNLLIYSRKKAKKWKVLKFIVWRLLRFLWILKRNSTVNRFHLCRQPWKCFIPPKKFTNWVKNTG